MKIYKTSISLTEDQRDAMLARQAALGYRSFNSYLIGLIRADIITAPAHDLPKKIAGMSERQRDRIDGALVGQAKIVAEADDNDAELGDNVIAIAQAYRAKRLTLPGR